MTSTPFTPTDFHYQRTALRKGADGKLRGTLWLVRTPEHLAFVDWAGIGFALRMALLMPLFLIGLLVPIATGALVLGAIGAVVLGIIGLVGMTMLLVWAGSAVIPKPKPSTYLKKAVYVIARERIAEVKLASDYRDAVLIVQHDGTSDLVHVQGRDQFLLAMQPRQPTLSS